MRAFRVLLNGVVIREAYRCMGHFDVANDLFGDRQGYASVIPVDRTDGNYEFILLDYGHSRLVIEPIGEPSFLGMVFRIKPKEE